MVQSLVKACKDWFAARKIGTETKRRLCDTEYTKHINYMMQNNICLGCKGMKRVDIPPWGIMVCDECEGTGKVDYSY